MSCPIFSVDYAGGLPWQARALCQFSGINWQTNPNYGVSVAHAGASPPAVSQTFAYFYHTDFQI
ncbi:MAG: hypothetical protein SFZ02_07440 [bacterium]|nr:hypothetical protein [bacterium]